MNAVSVLPMSVRSIVTVITLVAAAFATPCAFAQTFTTRTMVDGLGSKVVTGVFVDGTTVYAATEGGLSISDNRGVSFVNRTRANGLGSNLINGVYVVGNSVYAATSAGLSVSKNGGTTFTNKTTADGLGGNWVYCVFAVNNVVYAGTLGGLSISIDGGATFTNKGSAAWPGLGSANPLVAQVYAAGTTVYVAMAAGIYISSDGGASFTRRLAQQSATVYAAGNSVYSGDMTGNLWISPDGTNFVRKSAADGLSGGVVTGIFSSGNAVYAATRSGLSISVNSGAVFSTKTTAQGLGDNNVTGIQVANGVIYAATANGLSIGTAATGQTVPGAPTGVSASADNAKAYVSFTAPANDGGAAITGYTATCTSSNGGLTGTASGAASPLTVNSLTNGKTYTCLVAATNSVGTGSASAASNAITPGVLPSAPTDLKARPGNASVVVSFTPGALGTGTLVAYFAHCTSGGLDKVVSGAQSPLTVTGLTNGASYYCSAATRTTVGDSPWVGAGDGTVGVPTEVLNVSAKPMPMKISLSFSPPSSQGASAITGYEATCSTDNWQVNVTATGAASPIVVSKLSPSKSYICSVWAKNSYGLGWGGGTVFSVKPLMDLTPILNLLMD